MTRYIKHASGQLFTQLASQYRSDESSFTQTDPTLEDIILALESDEISLLLVFNMIEIYQAETGQDQFTFAINSLGVASSHLER